MQTAKNQKDSAKKKNVKINEREQQKKAVDTALKNAQERSKKEKQISEVTKVNISAITSKFADKLKSIELKERLNREHIYIYPETLKTESERNGKEGKKFRARLRHKLQNFAHNIFVYTKTNNIESLKKEIVSFDEFYKSNYRVNDYSFSSLSNTKNEVKEKDVKLMIEIIAEFKNQSSK